MKVSDFLAKTFKDAFVEASLVATAHKVKKVPNNKTNSTSAIKDTRIMPKRV